MKVLAERVKALDTHFVGMVLARQAQKVQDGPFRKALIDLRTDSKMVRNALQANKTKKNEDEVEDFIYQIDRMFYIAVAVDRLGREQRIDQIHRGQVVGDFVVHQVRGTARSHPVSGTEFAARKKDAGDSVQVAVDEDEVARTVGGMPVPDPMLPDR